MLRRLAFAVSVLIFSVPVYAGEVEKAEKGQIGWVSVVVALLLVVAVGIGCFMNPKRTHQD